MEQAIKIVISTTTPQESNAAFNTAYPTHNIGEKVYNETTEYFYEKIDSTRWVKYSAKLLESSISESVNIIAVTTLSFK